MPKREDVLAKELKSLVAECFADGKLDSGEILKIGVFAAQKVNVLEGLSGDAKKHLVLKSVDMALRTALPRAQYEKVGSKFALQILPVVLDIAVSAANGKLALGKPTPEGILSCLLSCMMSVKKADEPVLLSDAPKKVAESSEDKKDDVIAVESVEVTVEPALKLAEPVLPAKVELPSESPIQESESPLSQSENKE